MKIQCKWLFKENKKNIKTPQLETKYKPNIQDMNMDEIGKIIIDLMARPETVRLIFEKEE